MELSNLKPLITARLESLVDIGVYDTHASDGASYPYLVYSFPFAGSNSNRISRFDRIMEIDYWNDSNNDSDILLIAETVKNGTELIPGLNNSLQTETQGFYKCYIEGDTFEIKDPNKDITHLKQTYLFHIG